MRRRTRRRRCLCCGELFCGDPRTRSQQKYCSQPPCRAASKLASQKRWLQKPENQDYFCGPQHVNRVQAWREAHPDYGREAAIKGRPLQETRTPQPIARQRKSTRLALQEKRQAEVVDAVDRNGMLAGTALQDAM